MFGKSPRQVFFTSTTFALKTRIADLTDVFRGSDFKAFAGAIAGGAVVRGIPAPGAARWSRSVFDKLNDWARAEMQALVTGTTFDRARAQALVEAKTNAVRTKSPEVIAAMADFYDSLKPEQQQKVREFMAKRRGWRS